MLVVVDIADFAGERFWHVLKSELQEFEDCILLPSALPSALPSFTLFNPVYLVLWKLSRCLCHVF